MSSHALARDLLKEPDTFLTAMYDDEELVIDSYKRIATHANIDDRVVHLALILRDGGQGNIKK